MYLIISKKHLIHCFEFVNNENKKVTQIVSSTLVQRTNQLNNWLIQ